MKPLTSARTSVCLSGQTSLPGCPFWSSTTSAPGEAGVAARVCARACANKIESMTDSSVVSMRRERIIGLLLTETGGRNFCAGAQVTVGDVSEVQLALNRERVAAAGCETAVCARLVLDIVDLSDLPSERFDAVVAYGGPLSYVMERADEALAELLRVTRRGGHVLLSVMSLVGATHKFAGSCVKWARERSLADVEHVIHTGDQTGEI